MRRLIGGDFELGPLSLGSTDRLADLTHGLAGTWTASGRAALALVLQHLQARGVRHVHLPSYLCESVLLPVQALGLEYSFYPVHTHLTAYPDPPPGSAVILIHYFGWLNPVTAELRAEAGHAFDLIEDYSQAMLSDWSALPDVSRFVFFSPRKFGPALLGGWCNIHVELGDPSNEVEALAWRSLAARLARGAYLAEPNAPLEPAVESFYLEAFRAVEIFLNVHPTSATVPQIALNIIEGLDWNDIASRRCANWLKLNELLSGIVDPLTNVLPDDVVPLGYVIRLENRDEVRRKLREHRIFCSVHWPLPSEVNPLSFPDAALLSKSILTIPIDQRYDQADMLRIAHVIKTLL